MKSNILITIFIISFFSIYSFAQTTYYVSTSGDNSNDGTSTSTAFASIQQGINTVSAGDVVEILAGTYSTETIWLDNKHGSSGNIITIKNYQSDVVTIDGTNLGSDRNLFYLENTSYITIQGLIVENNEQNNASGFNIQGNCQDISILNCEIRNINFDSDPNATASSSNNAYPLIVYATDGSNANTNILISENKIYDCRTGWSEGLALNGNIDGFELSGNEVYNISNIGIDAIGFEGTASSNDYVRNGLIKNNIVHDCPSPYADCGGIYVDGGRDIIIENNTCYNNQYGIEIGNEHSGTTTEKITVRNNVFYNNTLVGIKIGGYEGDVTDCSVTGNVCYNNNTDNAWRGELELSDKLTNTVIKNNIFYAKNTDNLIILAEGTEKTGLDLDYNIYYHSNSSSGDNFDWYGSSTDGNFSKFQETGHGSHSGFTDPLFVDLTNNDFHIQSTSPAIDAGDPTYTAASGEVDMDGQTRIYNSIIDCGADECSSTTPTPTLVVTPASLSNYTYTQGAGPSLSQNIALSGTNLDGSQISIASPTHYEISLDNSSFSQSINIDYSGSTLSSTTVFVRLIAGLSAGYYNNENLTCNDNGTATSITLTLSGSVSNTTGIQNAENKASWSVFTENQNLHILYSKHKQAVIQVFNMSGKLVKQQKVLLNHTVINLSVPEEIYIVKLIDKNFSDTKKVFIRVY